MTIAVDWIREEREGDDSYGYRAQSVRTREAAAAFGLVEDKGAPIVVRVCSPARFVPEDDRPHVLFTNVEAPLWQKQIEAASRAACIVTISDYCADRFREALPLMPVYVAPLGVDRIHAPTLRQAPATGEPFRWLWVGAPSPRKGWDRLTGTLAPGSRGGVWHKHGWAKRADVELRMKWSRHAGQSVTPDGNVIYDCRRLTVEELAALYRDAHGFILPSYGEGQGLTLAEAMSSGAPCVYTPGTGTEPWGEGWPVEVDMIDAHGRWPERYPERALVPQARLSSLDEQMRAVMADYPEAAERAYQIGRRVYSGLTWEATGRAFVDALKDWRAHPRGRSRGTRAPSSIGIYFANGMGNLTVMTPALAAIRSHYPDARIDLVLGVEDHHRSDWNVIESLARCYIGRLYDDVRVVPQSTRLARGEYDLTLAHQHGHASQLRESMRQRREPEPDWWREHEACAYMSLARSVGYTGPVPDMVPPIDAKWSGVGSDYIAVCDGAERNPRAQRKRWPARHWHRIAAAIRGWYGLRVVQIGGPKEWAGGPDIEDATGGTVEESARLLVGARAFVTTDTFAMHMGSALDVPLVVMFGPTLESKDAPWTNARHRIVRSQIACSPCWGGAKWQSCTDAQCMASIEPGAVFRALREIIDGLSAAGGVRCPSESCAA